MKLRVSVAVDDDGADVVAAGDRRAQRVDGEVLGHPFVDRVAVIACGRGRSRASLDRPGSRIRSFITPERSGDACEKGVHGRVPTGAEVLGEGGDALQLGAAVRAGASACGGSAGVRSKSSARRTRRCAMNTRSSLWRTRSCRTRHVAGRPVRGCRRRDETVAARGVHHELPGLRATQDEGRIASRATGRIGTRHGRRIW
jgi:hypothetical protein